ncbi:MAG: hypothetical protein WC397_03365 [Candidatus Paceibacterota bacterium]|jgi:hypothetical protein
MSSNFLKDQKGSFTLILDIIFVIFFLILGIVLLANNGTLSKMFK